MQQRFLRAGRSRKVAGTTLPQVGTLRPETQPEKLMIVKEWREHVHPHERLTLAAARDVWALGIILINLITTVNPWHTAEPQDPNFAHYIRDPQHFFEPLHLPKDVEALILSALVVDPYRRISLDGMRDAVQSISSFLPEVGCGTGEMPSRSKI